MKKIVKNLGSGEVEVSLEEHYQSLRLQPNNAVRIINLAGARVRISNDGDMLRVEGKVPESGESLRWHYDLNQEDQNICCGHTDLCSLISSYRVELNGAL